MNAAVRKWEEPGDEAPRDDVAPWPSADDPADDPEPAPSGAPPAPRDRAAALEAAVAEQRIAGWIEAIVDRDESALAALYDATFSRVFGLARRIVRDTAMAEEVVEDAYFQVWRQAVRFDRARGKASSWLLALARSRAIDALRRERRFQHEPLHDTAQPEAPGLAPGADELLDVARHRTELHRALMRLGAQPRQLVSLAFFRGMSHEEIAQHTMLPLGTVKSQIRRALLSLRQTLGDPRLQALVS